MSSTIIPIGQDDEAGSSSNGLSYGHKRESFRLSGGLSQRKVLADMMVDNDNNNINTHSRLKRLSLVPKQNPDNSSTYARPSRFDTNVIGRGGTIHDDSSVRTPKNTGRGSRIAYSPRSPNTVVRPTRLDYGASLLDEREGEGAHRSVREDEEAQSASRTGETIVERHADLLTLIAQKERRVNELREELAAQEATLASLKQRWTTLISVQTPTSQPSIRPLRPAVPSTTSSQPRHVPTSRSAISLSPSVSTSSNLSALSSAHSEVDTLPSLDQSIANLLSSIPIPTSLPINHAAEKILNGEAIEGGKRFWDTLVKTVSAAAGGTVPEPLVRTEEVKEKDKERAIGLGGGVGDKRKMLRPANAARLSPSTEGTIGLLAPLTGVRGGTAENDQSTAKSRSLGITNHGSACASSGLEDLLSGDDEVMERPMTPRRPSRSSDSGRPSALEDAKTMEKSTDGSNGTGWVW